MSSQSASHAETVVHAVTTVRVALAATTAEVTVAHAATTEAQEVRAATAAMLLKLQSRTTSRRCSNLRYPIARTAVTFPVTAVSIKDAPAVFGNERVKFL